MKKHERMVKRFIGIKKILELKIKKPVDFSENQNLREFRFLFGGVGLKRNGPLNSNYIQNSISSFSMSGYNVSISF